MYLYAHKHFKYTHDIPKNTLEETEITNYCFVFETIHKETIVALKAVGDYQQTITNSFKGNNYYTIMGH